MRIIKFRAIRLYQGQVGLSNEHQATFEMCKKETLGEFTGLLDKNGVEIYEGDIVDFEDLKGLIQRGHICYRAGSFRISNKLGVVNHTDTEVRMWYDGNNEWYSIENLDQMDIEVIGNIHKTPELLK